MQINALGVGDANILWNCTVDIHQLNHPDSTAVSGSL
jgi:hypothetical protein